MTTSPEPRLIAQVAVDVSLPHLDRVFDYEVPARIATPSRPVFGCGSG